MTLGEVVGSSISLWLADFLVSIVEFQENWEHPCNFAPSRVYFLQSTIFTVLRAMSYNIEVKQSELAQDNSKNNNILSALIDFHGVCAFIKLKLLEWNKRYVLRQLLRLF